MKCPKCGSDGVVIATAGNGFGGWKCNSCNASGVYPPKLRSQTMARVFSILLVLLAFTLTPTAEAQYHNGYTSPSGYTYQNGYWYRYGQQYTRSAAYAPAYYSYGVYYPGYDYWVYTPYYPPQSYPQPAQQSYSALDDDAFYQKTITEREKHKRKMELIAKLGYDGTQPPGLPYGAAYGGYSYSGNLYNYTIPVTGNTQYGYPQASYQQVIARLYGDDNTGLLFQQSYQLSAQAAGIHDKAVAAFQATVQSQGESRAKVADTIAKMAGLAEIARAVNQAPPAASYKGYSFNTQPQQPGGNPPGAAPVKNGLPGAVPGAAPPTPGADPADVARIEVFKAVGLMVKDRCFACHSGDKPKGGFDANTLPSVSAAVRADVYKRITLRPGHPEYQAKMMPRDAKTNGPGTPLTPEEIALYEEFVFYVDGVRLMPPGEGQPSASRNGIRNSER